MDNGIGILGLMWLAFIGWLMWSSEEQKQMFLAFSLAIMLAIAIIEPTIHMLK